MATDAAEPELVPLDCFACPNPQGESSNRFAAGNLSVGQWMGRFDCAQDEDKAIRRLYCSHCQRRFSERQRSRITI